MCPQGKFKKKVSLSKKKNNKSKVETTGHSWDGIEEYNNPLPRWWLWVWFVSIIFSIIINL